MIRLGTHDPTVSESARGRYAELVRQATRLSLAEIRDGHDKLRFHARSPAAGQAMSVSEVQGALVEMGFFPGGAVDGVCGYRTHAAIRLFQEHVRVVEGAGGVPDGLFGPKTEAHVRRWLDGGLTPDWAPVMNRWRDGSLEDTEYERWLALGRRAQEAFSSQPTRALRMVRDFEGATDTRAVDDWDFGPERIHLFGIRRDQFSGKFDDVFVLLLKGLVFKFQGSTEPGSSSHPDGRPFLVQGQHDYHFGWHQSRYLALRPRSLGGGVLVVRSRDEVLGEDDFDRGLSTNATINIHWAGKGLAHDVNNWSEGCQVITGSLYIDHRGELVDCSGFVARNNGEVSASRTRGAYNVMVDLATALSGDMEDQTVRYTLFEEGDLDLDPDLRDGLARARERVMAGL